MEQQRQLKLQAASMGLSPLVGIPLGLELGMALELAKGGVGIKAVEGWSSGSGELGRFGLVNRSWRELVLGLELGRVVVGINWGLG